MSISISIKHFSNSFKSDLVHHMTVDFGESNTDTSTWRPDISLIHAQAGRNSGLKPVFDFPDGKDNPDSWSTTIIRRKGLDVTEVDTLISATQNSLDSKIQSDKKSKEKTPDDVMRENIQKLADKMTGDSLESTTSSQNSAK